MAIVSNSVNGNLKGQVGDIIYRERHGKTEAYIRKKKTIIKSRKVKSNQKDFGVVSSFCSAQNKVELLKDIWRNSPEKGVIAYNKMVRLNKKNISDGFDVSKMMLAPGDNKFQMEISSVQFTPQKLEVITGIYPERISGEKLISLQGVLHLSDPSDKNWEMHEFLPVYTKNEVLKKDSEVRFEMKFDSADSMLIKEYTVRRLLLNLVVKNIQGQPERISVEFFIEGV